MIWPVLFHEAFEAEFQVLEEGLQDELLAHARLLGEFGPNLGRPTVDGHEHLASLVKENKHGKNPR